MKFGYDRYLLFVKREQTTAVMAYDSQYNALPGLASRTRSGYNSISEKR